MSHKRIFILLFILPLILLSITGCTYLQEYGIIPSQPEKPQEQPEAQPQPESPPEKPPAATAPASPLTVEVSFPDGAPPLNREAQLICEIDSGINAKSAGFEIRLPEGLELVSGDLSWVGDITEGDEVEVIRAVVRAVKIGNWTIEHRADVNPEIGGLYISTDWYSAIYVSISEDSAEWRKNPPYGSPSLTPKRID